MLKIDGTEYNVRVVYGSLARAFEIVEGANAGASLTGARIRDIVGTAFSYSLQVEPVPNAAADYDALYEKLAEPVDTHTVELPYGQTTLKFDAIIEAAADTFSGTVAGVKKWNGLTLNFNPEEPQRR